MIDIAVVLKNIRIRGLGNVIDSQWFEIGNDLTFFALPEDFNRQGFLEALQTINPPYAIEEKEPFREYPFITRQGRFQKRVRPHRRTIAFAIFIAQSNFVKKLAEITPHLYEADRIEVGRRFDYSRWINFVEIAGSTRWGEIRRAVMGMTKEHRHAFSPFLQEKIQGLKQTDRVINDFRELLHRALLMALENENNGEKRKKLYELCFVVQRQEHFRMARLSVERHLPRFDIINGAKLHRLSYEAEGRHDIAVVAEYVDSVFSGSESRGETRPIVLVDEPDLQLGAREKAFLRDYAVNITKKCQCLYFLHETELAEVADMGGRVVTMADILPQDKNS